VNARRRVERVQHLLKEIGLEPERIEMFNTSAAMAGAFADAAKLMTERIESLGPNPLANHRGESQKENES
jgi:coenzyme F420-reducing hydrogenase delta subunit